VEAEPGVQICDTYQGRDKPALCTLLADYDETEKHLMAFYDAYQAQ
jgi:hypothetical protein